jgi:hypothetical protein
VSFWVALALDYLPVLAGASEMPRLARAVVLAAVAVGLVWILHRWVLQRTIVPLADRSMAILLERRFRGFRDSLITAVELADSTEATSPSSRDMLDRTRRHALAEAASVRTVRVFNSRPLLISLVAATVFLATVGGLYLVNAEALEVGMRRLVLLDDEPWPRRARIAVTGVEMTRSSGDFGAPERDVREFVDRRVKVARGSDVRLVVQADAAAQKVPHRCTFYYRTQDGDRGRVNMTRTGRIRDGYQYYRYEGRPLRGILADVSFDVVGLDHRLSGHLIEVVDSPSVVDCQMDCVFPSYLVDEELSSWLPRTIPLTSGTQLPEGTRITLRISTNKDCREVSLKNLDAEEEVELPMNALDGTARGFSYDLAELQDSLQLDVTLRDTDDIASDRPHRLYIQAIADEPPVVDVRLDGISTAVTPIARIAFVGTLSDDYGLQDSWVEVTVNDDIALEQAVPVRADGEMNAELDLREQRDLDPGLQLKPGDEMNLVVKASDRYDLGEETQIGSGDNYRLQVVSPDELLALLEAREIGLRRRFEQIVQETTETRDMLLRVQADESAAASDQDASGDSSEDAPEDEAPQSEAKRAESLRLLRTQQAQLQSQKSSQETRGVAAAFRDIRQELIANRVDTEDRKQRLEEKIAQPLERIVETMFPELDDRLQTLENLLKARDMGASSSGQAPNVLTAADASVAQSNAILLAMAEVLQNMLDLETYNELLDIVRALIEDQENLMNETKKQQKQQLLDLLQ